MKLYSLLLLAAAVAGGKKSKLERKREKRDPLATRNTELATCHKIKNGINSQSLAVIANEDKKCKCLTGWKKKRNKENNLLECTQVNTKATTGKYVTVYDTYSEVLARNPNVKPTNCAYVHSDTEKIVDCKGVGWDSKKAKKVLVPADTEILDWSQNHISDIHYTWYEGLKDLKKLSFANNYIRNIKPHTLRGSYDLEEIDLSFNQFYAFNNSGLFKKNPNLRVVKMNNNIIKELKMKVISILPHLEHFEGQHNRIARITGAMFSKAKNLQYLDFSYNNIERIATKAFQENIFLKTILLNNNLIKSLNNKLFSKNLNLEVLNLGWNQIPQLKRDSFRNLAAVKKIHLNNNLIVEINENAFKGLKQLEYINLDHNAIESIHQGAFTNCLELKYVFARYNQIKSLDGSIFNTNSMIKIAFLSHNEMESIDENMLKDKTELKRLDIGNNAITHLGNVVSGSQANLQFAYLDANNLQSADDNMLANAPGLTVIDASSNKLTDDKLTFVANAIDNSGIASDRGLVDLSDNQFTNPRFDGAFAGKSDIEGLRTEISNQL